MVDQYPESIQLMAKFTVESLQMWQFGPNSIHYLLSLWQRMVASVPYVKATEPHLLETYTPEVTQAYIHSLGKVNVFFDCELVSQSYKLLFFKFSTICQFPFSNWSFFSNF